MTAACSGSPKPFETMGAAGWKCIKYWSQHMPLKDGGDNFDPWQGAVDSRWDEQAWHCATKNPSCCQPRWWDPRSWCSTGPVFDEVLDQYFDTSGGEARSQHGNQNDHASAGGWWICGWLLQRRRLNGCSWQWKVGICKHGRYHGCNQRGTGSLYFIHGRREE